MLIGGVLEFSEASKLTEVLVVSIIKKDVIVTEDVETASESAIVVPFFFAVFIMVRKFAAAVVDAVIPFVKGDRVDDDFVVRESFKAVEESIGIRMVFLGAGSVAAVVGAAIEATPIVAADSKDVEVDFEVVGIALATNVVFFKEITERVISTENVFEVVRLDVLAGRTDSALMFGPIVCWGAVVSVGASVVIGVAIVSCNCGVGESIVGDTIAASAPAVIVWVETASVIVDNETVLKFVIITLATNVVISTEITERAVSVEGIFEFVTLDAIAVGSDSVLVFEFIVRWGDVVNTGASVVIGVAIVACNGSVIALITVVDDTAALTGGADEVSEANTVIEISVTSSLEKDKLVIEDFGIVDGSNTVLISFAAVLVMVLELVASVIDGVTPVSEGGVVADSAFAERYTTVKEGVAVTMGLKAV